MNGQTQSNVQVLSEEVIRRIMEEVRRYSDVKAHGVVHVFSDDRVRVDDELVFADDEIAVVFFNRGKHYVVVYGTPDGYFIGAMGDGKQVREKMEKMHESAIKALQRKPHDLYATYDATVAEIFFAVDEALSEDP